MKMIRTTLVLFALLTIVTGVLYPLAMTSLAQRLLPEQANGSVLLREGKAIGSTLIGQQFTQSKYFWGRLSATRPLPYDANDSTGSNLGPLSNELRSRAEQRLASLKAADPAAVGLVPVDLATASGSGLDPHISPAAAYYQARRVARSRGWTVERVRELIDSHIEGRSFGFLGEPRVNVLRLNLALDDAAPQSR